MATVKIYQNRDTGEILTAAEMRTEWREQYDGDDPTNMFSWRDQYQEIDTGTDPQELIGGALDGFNRAVDELFK